MGARERLQELGHELPSVAAPLASYVPATRVGSQVWTSGQLPVVGGELPATGKVGAEVSLEQAQELARTASLNALAAVDALVGLDQVTRVGSQVWTSGQLPVVGGELPATGKVGAEVSLEQAQDLARTASLNALAAIDSLVGLDQVTRVVKVVGFVASDPSFTEQAAVINGASDFLGEVFGEAGVHARSAVGVAVLPKNSPVEIEVIVEIAE